MKYSLADFRRKYPFAEFIVGPPVRLPVVAKVGGAEIPRRRKKSEMVQESISVNEGVLTIVCAVETFSEINGRDWRERSKRTKAARIAVRSAIAHRLDLLHTYSRHYTAGGTLKVTFTRLGGKKLDRMANLGTALKGVEDAFAYLLFASDGDARWRATAEQEPGGEVGVRITVEMT